MVDPDPAAVARVLRGIDGLASAVVDPGPGAGTLRLVLTPDADPQTVGEQVRHRLAESFGLGVGAAEPAPAAVAGSSAPRLAVIPGGTATPDGLVTARSGAPHRVPAAPAVPFAPVATRFRLLPYGPDRARLEISVAAGGREATGVAEVPDTTEGLRLGVAEATTRAVTTLRADTVSPQVLAVEVTDAGSAGLTATVRLSGTDAAGRPATGSAAVGDDVRLAVVRAVLDAAARQPAPTWWTRPGAPGAREGGPR